MAADKSRCSCDEGFHGLSDGDVYLKTHAPKSSSLISPAAAEKKVLPASKGSTFRLNPLRLRNMFKATKATRLLPSENG
jgi:hypothetical protein